MAAENFLEPEVVVPVVVEALFAAEEYVHPAPNVFAHSILLQQLNLLPVPFDGDVGIELGAILDPYVSEEASREALEPFL